MRRHSDVGRSADYALQVYRTTSCGLALAEKVVCLDHLPKANSIAPIPAFDGDRVGEAA